MTPLFSIIIPTYNGEKTIGNLLNKLVGLTDNYSKEIIVMDSQSEDRTLTIVRKYLKKIDIKIKKIKKQAFNHGETRNMGVKMAKGTFVWFLSQDALPLSKNILGYYLEDFRLDKKNVAVFGGHKPYRNTPIIQKLEVMCRWERLNKYVNKKGVLIQNKENPFIPLEKQNLLDWYVLSNTSCCYRRDFLIRNPFPKTDYGEDLMLGKKIIEMGLSKVYDTRCSVLHSHIYTIKQYCQRESKDLNLRLVNIKLGTKINLWCKIKKIIFLNCPIIFKPFYLIQLFFYYFLKFLIVLNLKLKNENST